MVSCVCPWPPFWASVSEAGLYEHVQPPGQPDIVNVDEPQVALSVFVTLMLYVSGVPGLPVCVAGARKATVGAPGVQGTAPQAPPEHVDPAPTATAQLTSADAHAPPE